MSKTIDFKKKRKRIIGLKEITLFEDASNFEISSLCNLS